MKRKRNRLFAWIVPVLAVIAVLVGWNVRDVRERVVDYWQEQSSRYTAFRKELTAGTLLEQTVYVESISENKYAYQFLDEEGKQVYDEILHAILNHMDKITVATLDTEVLQLAFEEMSSDYGGLFWISGYSYTEYTRNGEVVCLEFAPIYTMDYEERKKVQQQIDGEVERFLRGVSQGDSDYEKAKYVFENLIREVDYDRDVKNSQNIISTFLEKKTVCQGYACAALYLLNQLNISGAIVTGSANGDAHAWNLVQLDGAYYYMDPTWGNSMYLDGDSRTTKFVNYAYMAFTTDEMMRTHTPDDHMRLPECTAISDSYFVREGLYFTEWLPDEIGEIYGQAIDLGQGGASVKFSTDELCERAKKFFIDQKRLGDYCAIYGSVYYLQEDDQRILTISMK